MTSILHICRDILQCTHAFPQCTYDIPHCTHDIPRWTEHPRCTADIMQGDYFLIIDVNIFSRCLNPSKVNSDI